MKINITGKHMDLGEALQTHIEGRLDEGITKYIDRINTVNVVMSKDGSLIKADIHANAGTHSHMTINATAENHDVYAAFDAAADKVEKQLRRYKRRLKDHHMHDTEPKVARDYVIAPEAAEEVEEESAPAIIADTHTHIETLSVSQAVMRMDLADIPAYMFYNSQTGRINMIYRRKDGNISWVDPEEMQAAA